MSISNEALQKLVQEIETQALQAQQQIQVVRSTIAVKTREQRLKDLTTREMNSLPEGTNVYQGVGKMFVLSSTKEVEEELATEAKDLKKEMENLNSRLHYLETTHKNSREHMEQIFKNSGNA